MSTQERSGRTRRAFVVAGAVVIGLVGFVVWRATHDGSAPVQGVRIQAGPSGAPSSTDLALVAKSAAFVRDRTGITPKEAAVYHTTRAAAAKAVDANLAGFDPAQEVVVIEYSSGSGPVFVDENGSGDAITFVYDPRSELSTDYGIGPAPARLDGIGEPMLVHVQS